MQIFFNPKDIPNFLKRGYLADWIKPLFPNPRHTIYGLGLNDLKIAKKESDANCFILPLTWNYYFQKNKLDSAKEIIKKYEKWNKPILTWLEGDYNYKIPKGTFILFRRGGYQSERLEREYEYPVIIKDPLIFLDLKEIKILTKSKYPKVGFCGLSDKNILFSSFRFIDNLIKKIFLYFMRPYVDLSKPISGTRLRRKVIAKLNSHSGIETNFLIKNSSGGQSINSEKSKLEFWENILTSPYVICSRGAGNFSARFYETLALGRIPVFINTDCILPFDNIINWRNNCVWIEADNIKSVPDILLKFHNNLSEEEFKKIQIQNRELWINRLSFSSFLNTFNENFIKKNSL